MARGVSGTGSDHFVQCVDEHLVVANDGHAWQGIIVVRLIKDAIVYPIQVAVSYAVLKGVARIKPTL